MIDEGITVNIPARPEFNATTVEETRVWNTDCAVRPSDQRQQHLGRALAA